MNRHIWRIGFLSALLAATVGILLAHIPGRMTGGGSIFPTEGPQTGIRITHGFEIHCAVPEGSLPPVPNNLEVNWRENGVENNFHLEVLEIGNCSDAPDYAEPPPVAGFDTFFGEGTGRLNGVDGYRIFFLFTDKGEPGTLDDANYVIRDPEGNVVLNTITSVNLTFGNHQAHKCTGQGPCASDE